MVQEREIFLIAEQGDELAMKGSFEGAIECYREAARLWREWLPVLEKRGQKPEADWAAIWEGKRMLAALLMDAGRTPAINTGQPVHRLTNLIVFN